MSDLVKMISVVDVDGRPAHINPNFITCIRVVDGHYHVHLAGAEIVILTEESYKTFRPKMVFV
jgi:uncharacterized protein YlzI (FlbEa/FlbD family)